MTTRKSSSGKAGKASKLRVKRPEPARTMPDRSGASARLAAQAAAKAQLGGEAPPSSTGGDAKLDEAVAGAVQSGYDVLAEAIAQGRAAAGRLRQGDLSMPTASADMQALSLRMIQLARQLSAATLDMCEQMVQQLGTGTVGAPPPGEVAKTVPPFRKAAAKPASAGNGPDLQGKLAFATRFEGAGSARTLTHSVSRPDIPALPEQISATPLQPRSGKGKPLIASAFAVDMSTGRTASEREDPQGAAGRILRRNDRGGRTGSPARYAGH